MSKYQNLETEKSFIFDSWIDLIQAQEQPSVVNLFTKVTSQKYEVIKNTTISLFCQLKIKIYQLQT